MQHEPVETFCSSEFKKIKKKHQGFEKNFEQASTLLNQQLCPKKTVKPLTSKHLNRLHVGDGFEVWKFQVFVKGLKQGQWPRLWVGVAHEFDLLVPLEMGMHGDNYDDNTKEKNAIRAMSAYVKEMREN